MKLDEMLKRIEEYYNNRDIIPPVNIDNVDDDNDEGVVASPDIDMDGEGDDDNVEKED
jgi:hypothetical protein